jgi:hypothetical protein
LVWNAFLEDEEIQTLNNIEALKALKRNKYLVKEKLVQVKKANEGELLLATNMKRVLEQKFCNIWNKYQLDSKFVEKEFSTCCEQLVELIVGESKARIEFEKIYKPYQDEYQRLAKEYSRLKIEFSVTRKPKTKRSKS